MTGGDEFDQVYQEKLFTCMHQISPGLKSIAVSKDTKKENCIVNEG